MMLSVRENKKLNVLIAGLAASDDVISDTTILGLSLDSRRIDAGWMFLSLAQKPEHRNAHLKQALELGAKVVLFDREMGLTAQQQVEIEQAKVECYAISSLAQKASEIAARFYDHPSQKMTVIAVTGTNGKTSVSQFIAQALAKLGIECGVIGTLGVGRLSELSSTGMTTPDPIYMQAVLAEFYEQGIRYVALEASSHALEQGRLNAVGIDVAILTNLSRDHLDYHNTMEEYAQAKKKLFEMNSVNIAVLNVADDFGRVLMDELVSNSAVKVMSYSSYDASTHLTFAATNIESNLSGMTFDVVSEYKTIQIQTHLLGRFNIDNLLAAIAGLVAIEIQFENACQAVAKCQAVDGRMQSYSADNKAEVVIDFAHTPDALSQALQSLRKHLPANGLLWCVFGCGGDRDKGKRSVMGRCAEEYADKVVLTADNPRSENNEDIVLDILGGILQQQQVHIEHDRQKAIDFAVSQASQNDIVLVAGKGHEDYQEISGQKFPFSDVNAVAHALQAANDDNHNIAEAK